MNYLLHLLLSTSDTEHLVGNIIGDFVKGTLHNQYPPGIIAGLRQHRRLDSFARDNEIFRRSCARIDKQYGRYRPIIIDIFYDHFTAVNWQRYHQQGLEEFAAAIYASLQQRREILPDSFRSILPRMIDKNWLCAYRDPATIKRALSHIGSRITRPNQLHLAASELQRHYTELENDCHIFITAARTAGLDVSPLYLSPLLSIH